MKINNTSTKYYLTDNDSDGNIVLTPCGETKHKPARHRVLMAEIERLEAENAELRENLRIIAER